MYKRDKGRETILVVEDIPEVMTVVTHLLELSDYYVLKAKTGEEAIAIFKENLDKINLVLLDLILPGISGKAVYHSIQRTAPTIPVLFSTGTSEYDEDITFLENQGLPIIKKPYSLKDLNASIRQALNPSHAGTGRVTNALQTH